VILVCNLIWNINQNLLNLFSQFLLIVVYLLSNTITRKIHLGYEPCYAGCYDHYVLLHSQPYSIHDVDIATDLGQMNHIQSSMIPDKKNGNNCRNYFYTDYLSPQPCPTQHSTFSHQCTVIPKHKDKYRVIEKNGRDLKPL